MNVTLFSDWYQAKETRSLIAFLNEIKQGRYEKTVKRLVEKYGDDDSTIALYLPLISVPGSFKTGTYRTGPDPEMTNYNGLHCLTLPYYREEDYKKYRLILQFDDSVLAIFRNPSKNKLIVIVNAGNSEEEHIETFQLLREFYGEKLEAKFKRNGEFICAGFTMTYDEEIYINEKTNAFLKKKNVASQTP